MSLNDIKPLGAFIENTVRPLLLEFKGVLDELKKSGIKLTEKNIFRLIDRIVVTHIITVIFKYLTTFFLACVIGQFIWKIYR